MNNTEVLYSKIKWTKLSKTEKQDFVLILTQLMHEVDYEDYVVKTRDMEYVGALDNTGESILTFKHELNTDIDQAFKLHADVINQLDWRRKGFELPFCVLVTRNTETNEVVEYSLIWDKPVISRETAWFEIMVNMPKMSPEQEYYILKKCYKLNVKYQGETPNTYWVLMADSLIGDK